MFIKNKSNGEKSLRQWLCYSPSKCRLYCFPCKLLCYQSKTFVSEGLKDWKNAIRNLNIHETSDSHCNASVQLSQLMIGASVDGMFRQQMGDEYWKTLLKRIIDVVKFLGERGLSFRGDIEKIGDLRNGNFLGLVELIGKYDTFMGEHLIKYSNKGSGKSSCLSHIITDEIIEILADSVLKSIIGKVKKSAYYSITVDSTQNISKTDQLAICLRYIEDGIPVERFLTFLELEGHSGVKLANSLINFLNDQNIDITSCRGQSYDNAANMSGNIMECKL